jgi:hypothetical protein
MRRFALLFAVLTSLAPGAEPAKSLPVDPATGMKIAPGWETVRNHCIACHSPTTFLRQRATEANWISTLEWMQKYGGLWKLDAEVERTIVQYLATHYGPGDATHYRRAPIPATLMPANPYSTDARREAEARRQKGLIPQPPSGSR